MHTLLRSTVILALLLTTTSALAQGPGRGGRGRGGPPPEPGLMTYELAAKAMTAAEAYTRSKKWSMTIRIVDQNNNVVMVHRLNDANPMTATIAERKTLTVIGSKMTSAEYGAKLKTGEVTEIEN